MNTSTLDPKRVPDPLASSQSAQPAPPPVTVVQPVVVVPRTRRWPALLMAGVVGAALAAWAVSSSYDDRSVGQRLDASVDTAKRNVDEQVDALKSGVADVSQSSAATGERAAVALSDAAITTAVKTALAADPSLSALRIEVSTEQGVVTLSGPAPDSKSRERASVLAAAPQGVRSVDNRLVVSVAPV